ncbi:uncharacterized protein DNG_01240 [Cephalotrichum gorgonifer]|uniref:Uncharacterized protein n=1 Tax=Cephalotrichum gorgonifer TaxID=2041049 RepID=A0AAE8MQS7_9PEZI|nr:uncharacterized protein DNG_01240 [Cephalotrichum gorgonifer]
MSQPREDNMSAGIPSSPNYTTADSDAPGPEFTAGPRRRYATVYDAVAGRVSSRDDDPLSSQAAGPGTRIREPRATRHSTRDSILAPEEVLFRRKEAPPRWPHHDIYMAHEHNLPDGGRNVLPSSDLLKAIHSYTSHFYEALGDGGRREAHLVGRRNINEGSMDETALLALGILLEEAGREVLGKRGDMVFTEGEGVPSSGGRQAGGPGDEREGLEGEGLADRDVSSEPEGAARRGRKRRKVSASADGL